MKFKLIWLGLVSKMALANVESDDMFQYDYCSWTHSQHVIDKVKSEI